MKNPIRMIPVLLALLFPGAQLATTHAQGTAFTYQGQLSNGTNFVTGLYNFKFDTFSASTGGSVIGGPVTNTAVPVTNGLFTTLIDFGTNVFTGATNWLHIQVTTNGGSNFTSLLPRQELTPTPYAIFAEGANAAGLSGTIPTASVSGTYGGTLTLSNVNNAIAGNGSGLTSLNASALTTGTITDALLAADVALTDANQTFTATNIFQTGTNSGRFLLHGTTGIDTGLFTGLGFQYNSSSGEGAIMSSFNDGFSSLTFYTKQGSGVPVAEQVLINRYALWRLTSRTTTTECSITGPPTVLASRLALAAAKASPRIGTRALIWTAWTFTRTAFTGCPFCIMAMSASTTPIPCTSWMWPARSMPPCSPATAGDLPT